MPILSAPAFQRLTLSKFILPAAALLCLLPWVDAGMALLLGILIGVTLGNPYLARTQGLTHRLLGLSVIGLGAGMNLTVVMQAGIKGFGYTIVSIAATLLLGTLLGKALRTTRDTSLLVTIGTAICGGSAIAAIAPVIRAKQQDISVALATVFTLNAAALFLFPFIGHQIGLSEAQFGLWSALAIHDTSSVVGAGLKYGPHALEIGTTVKLARALWIVPLVFAVQYAYSHTAPAPGETQQAKRRYPWFILGFIAMAALVTWVPALQDAGSIVELVARRLLVLTLFLIGANLTGRTLRQVGPRPMLQGIVLWIVVAGASLLAIAQGWIG